MSDDRVKSTEAEVQKLLDARIIIEVQYLVWVANVAMVPKKNGNMRMCIDHRTQQSMPEGPLPAAKD
jgi:hypothetical protein